MTTIRLRHSFTGHLLVEPFRDAASAAQFADEYLSQVAGRYVPVEVERDAVCDCLLCAAARKNETPPPMRGADDCGPGCARMGHDHRMCLDAAEPTDAELRAAEAERAYRRAAAFCYEDVGGAW